MDEQFQSGMPRQLRNYWVHGEGAARIRWGVPGDFLRCVRLLTQEAHGEIADPKGTCANLHHEALGKWPGREHMSTEVLEALVASLSGQMTPWHGPLAPINRPTDDGRMFPPSTLSFQSMPAPLEWVKTRNERHLGAVTVGTIDNAWERTDDQGNRWLWGNGRFFSPDDVPEAATAMKLAKEGVAYPSVDLVKYAARMVTNGEYTAQVATAGKMRAATLLAISAFPDLRIYVGEKGPEPQGAVRPFDIAPPPGGGWIAPTEAIYGFEDFAVNTAGWRNAPIAPRNEPFDADDAVARIEHWAGIGTDAADPNKLASMFLWINSENRPLLGREGYRLPWGDIIDGEPYLMYHAIYAGAALLSGGHGGLPNIPEAEKSKLRAVITDIYARLSKEFEDPGMVAPWDADAARTNRAAAAIDDSVDWCYCGEEFFCAETFDVILTEDFGDIEVEAFLGKYTESKHPRDPKGTDEGGEWTDVPGRGPHGQIKVGGKWVYPKRHRRTKNYEGKHGKADNPDHVGKHRTEGEASTKKSYKPTHAAKYRYHGSRRAEDAGKTERDSQETKAPEKKAVAPKVPAKKAAAEKKAPEKKVVTEPKTGKTEPAKKVAEAPERQRSAFAKTRSQRNPKVITDSVVPDGKWWKAVNDDTTAAGIPVRDLTVQGYHVKSGRLYRRNGVSYLVEAGDAADHKVVVDEFEDFHASLPADADKYQASYAWLAGKNPADVRWAERYNIVNFTSLATAGRGSVTMWGQNQKLTGKFVYVKEGPKFHTSTLRHEFGHNVSEVAGKVDLGDDSARWRAAGRDDTEANRSILGQIEKIAFGDGRSRGVAAQHKPDANYPHGVTNYGKSSPGEDYAESMSLFLAGKIGYLTLPGGQRVPVYFRDVFPHRADVLDKVFPQFAKAQRAEVDQRGPIPELGQ